MDPWGSDDSCESPLDLSFEDNFSPSAKDSLPDSEQYLAILEEKLRKIKNDPNILRQLSAKREACMQNLLNSEPHFTENDELEAPLTNSQLLRTICPQKQALNKGETVELVHYDHLNDSESE